MDNLNTEQHQYDYNEEPVFYCKSCLSLKIRFIKSMQDSEYCDECGSTDIGQCSIEEWQKLYKERYGHSYLEEYNNNLNR